MAEYETISTSDLVEKLISAQEANKTLQGKALRRSLFETVNALVRGGKLSHCFTRGKERENQRKQLVRPYIWHRPRAQCPHCRGTGFVIASPRVEVTPAADEPKAPVREPTAVELLEAEYEAWCVAEGLERDEDHMWPEGAMGRFLALRKKKAQGGGPDGEPW